MLETSINESDPLKINAPVEPARTTAKILLENKEEVICINANPDVCQAAQQDCTRVIFGNGLKTH